MELQAGTYLAFEASGPMPGAIVAAWQQVWVHFEGKGPWKRRYGTDFECYLGPELGRVCIGVVAA